MSSNKEKVERIKAFIKKDQPKVTREHFDWSQFEKISQFEKLIELKYNKDKDCYE